MTILFGICIIQHICTVRNYLQNLFCLIKKGIQSRTFKIFSLNLFQILKKGIEHYLETLDIHSTPMKVNHLSYTFITHSKHLVLNLLQNQPKLKVLVMSNFDQYHARSVAETLSYYCSNNFELEVWNKLELSIDSLKEHLTISSFLILLFHPLRIRD